MLNIISVDNHDSFYFNVNKLMEEQEWQWPNWCLYNTKNNYERISERGTISDASFIFQWQNEPVMIFFGFLDHSDNSIDVPSWSIERTNILTAKIYKAFLKEFDAIFSDLGGQLWYRDFLLRGKLSAISKYLLSKGATSHPIYSSIIDLNKEDTELKKCIKKRYKSHVNWGVRELKPKIYDKTNINWEIMNQFRLLHIQEAGKETRSEETWRRQLEMVEKNEAFVVCAYRNNQFISAGLFSISKNNCDYQVSVSRRDMFDKPLFHSLVWVAILHAKKIGCKWFELGEISYPNHPNSPKPSSKELGISEFKAGFGGDIKMFLDLKLCF